MNGVNSPNHSACSHRLQDRALQTRVFDSAPSNIKLTWETVSTRMFDAASRGDPAALKALREVRMGRRDDK